MKLSHMILIENDRLRRAEALERFAAEQRAARHRATIVRAIVIGLAVAASCAIGALVMR